MTTDEIEMIKALHMCRFLPGSYPKKFAGDLYSAMVHNKEKELSERQHDYLVKIFHMYRKQHGKHVEHLCPICKDKQKSLDDLEKLNQWTKNNETK